MNAPSIKSAPEFGTATSLTIALTGLLVAMVVSVAPGNAANLDYPGLKDITRTLEQLAKDSKHARVVELTETPGGHSLQMLQILAAGESSKRGGIDQPPPAILVIADPLGTTPLATTAALALGRMLTASTANSPVIEGRTAEFAWYILPVANPDAAARRSRSPVHADGRNDSAVDDDKDGALGEDPADDLNGDGLITTMLLTDPQGGWLLTEDDPPLPKEADAAKGEMGLYRKLTEGKDDDGDGRFNEDGPGGVVIGRNLPHAYEHWTATGGRWAASESESRAILEFAFSHPEIAMILVFGSTNTLAQVPESDKTAEASGGKYKLPGRFAERLGVDPDTEFELDTLVEMARDYTGMANLTADDVLAFLDLGAAVNPNRKDLAWWNALAERYQEFMKEAGLDKPRVDPAPSAPGSVEEWAYYQYGVPTFALDFWSLPKLEEAGAAGQDSSGSTPDFPTPDEIETMSREQAEQKQAEGVDPTLKALVSFSADRLSGQGYLPWNKVTLPDGREALVGGAAPFVMTTPPAAWSDSLLSAQLPFLLELVTWLPVIDIVSVELDHRGADVYEVKLHVGNTGRISYPTGQGTRCKRPPPVAVTIEGAEILEGTARQTIREVPGLGSASTRWLVRGKRGSRLNLSITTPSAGSDTRSVELDGEGGQR